jgi:hypothetical protein
VGTLAASPFLTAKTKIFVYAARTLSAGPNLSSTTSDMRV